MACLLLRNVNKVETGSPRRRTPTHRDKSNRLKISNKVTLIITVDPFLIKFFYNICHYNYFQLLLLRFER